MSEIRCGTCAFFQKVQDLPDGIVGGVCRFNPPTVFVITTQATIQGGRPNVQMITEFPPVNNAEFCGQHVPQESFEAFQLGRLGVITADVSAYDDTEESEKPN